MWFSPVVGVAIHRNRGAEFKILSSIACLNRTQSTSASRRLRRRLWRSKSPQVTSPSSCKTTAAGAAKPALSETTIRITFDKNLTSENLLYQKQIERCIDVGGTLFGNQPSSAISPFQRILLH